MVVTALTEPAMPALIKPLLDNTFVARDPHWIRLMPILLIGLFIVRGIAQYISSVVLAWVANRVVFDLRSDMFSRLVDLPVGYYAAHAPGELMSKLNYDVSQVTTATTSAVVVAIRDSLTVAGLLAWMLYLDWKLALLFLLVAPVISVIVKTISFRLRRMSLSLQRSMGSMTDVLGEVIRGSRVIKIYGGQEHERQRFGEIANWIRRYNMKIATVSAVSVPLVQLIIVMALAGSIYVTAGTAAMTVGGFVSFFGAAAMLFSPIKRLTSLNEQIARGLAAAESIFRFIDENPESDSGTRRLERAAGRLEFVGVGLRYEPLAEPVLSDIGFRIEPGQTVALVGASGAGKSSLINLIPRFYTPTAGRILLDGVDIQEIRLADLRANIAVVTQDVVLFNDTVAANIAYGVRGADRERIVAAATAACVIDFASEMPAGLDTPVGDNGIRLSGGQRQRLAIARALLKDAPILIMDEATSAIDSQTERQLQDALDNLRRGRTTIIIAHRLSTVEKADRILVLDKGRIVESGRHRELLSAGGPYAELYRAQFAEPEAMVGSDRAFNIRQRQT
jgi:subfamily B ATP-binding cassette protein MsbA